MATRAGARTLGLDAEIGAITAGRRADLIVIDRDRPHLLPGSDPFSTIVYAAHPSDVRATVIDGRVLMRDHALTTLDAAEVAARARTAAAALIGRAGL
jgi:5-methylthioadenosine/S-adenosylhomocysteine deaminase